MSTPESNTDREKLELLIDKKISDAKLEVTEKRLNYFIFIAGAIVSIFGIALPLFWSQQSTDRLDSAISQMKSDVDRNIGLQNDQFRLESEQLDKNFEELKKQIAEQSADLEAATSNNIVRSEKQMRDIKSEINTVLGYQNRKIILDCLYNNKALDGQTITVESIDFTFTLQVRNRGDKSAENISTAIYILDSTGNIATQGFDKITSDELDYNLKYGTGYGHYIKIEAQNTIDLTFQFYNSYLNKYPMMLKIFYGEKEPLKVKFFVIVK